MKIIFLFSIFFFFITSIKSSKTSLSFHYSSFKQNDISLFGDATLNNGKINLTKFGNDFTPSPAGPDTAGQMVNKDVLISSSSISFFTNFSFSISQVPNPGFSGYGFTLFFTSKPLESKYPPVGRFGLPKSFLAFVIDTTEGEDRNMVAHLSVSINNTFEPLKFVPISDEFLPITDGQIFYTWIEYDSQSNNFSAFMNYANEKPQHPVLFGTMDLSVFFKNDSTLYFGFSAYSLHHSEIYEIHSWDFLAISDESHQHKNNNNIIKIVLPIVAAIIVLLILIGLVYFYFESFSICLWSIAGPFHQVPQGRVEMVETVQRRD
ncbi:unnamed protein product [Trifolium pratense]|uniref:Uncharacterized protein n=1 Tax=Trifolium pratense TaxID=57577 RepID=A0ACB0K8V7_TRIPR|nr:unnamed protein product [Trifolium pratense]